MFANVWRCRNQNEKRRRITNERQRIGASESGGGISCRRDETQRERTVFGGADFNLMARLEPRPFQPSPMEANSRLHRSAPGVCFNPESARRHTRALL